MSFFEVLQTTFQYGFVYILLKLVQWNLYMKEQFNREELNSYLIIFGIVLFAVLIIPAHREILK